MGFRGYDQVVLHFLPHHQGILLYCDHQASTFDVSRLPCHSFEAMDHFPKCFLILRLDASQVEGGLQSEEGDSRGWRAVRVDLVSPPKDRYAFALLGWTGSRVRQIDTFIIPRGGKESVAQEAAQQVTIYREVQKKTSGYTVTKQKTSQ